MAADRPDECLRRIASHQCLDDRRFGQTRIFQRGMYYARLGIEQESGCHASRCSMGQRKPLPLRESFQPVDERLLGRHFDVRGNDGSKSYLHQVEGEQVPHHGDGKVSRRPGMLDQGQLHFAAFHDAAVPAEPIKHLGRQIALLQKDQGKVFCERRVRCGFS